MRRRSKARSNLAKAQRRKAEMPRRRAAPRLARERDEYPRRDELRPIMETALDAVIVMKSDGVVADWNDRAVGVFGWSREEAIGRIRADLIIPERYREAHRNGRPVRLSNRRHLSLCLSAVSNSRVSAIFGRRAARCCSVV